MGGKPGGLFVTPQATTNDAALKAWRTAHNDRLKVQAAEAQKKADEELARAKTELDKKTSEWEAKKKHTHEKNVAEV